MTLVDRESRPLARLAVSEKDQAGLALAWAQTGLRFIGQSGLQSLEPMHDSGRQVAALLTGEIFSVDEVLVCAGQRSAVEAFAHCGLQTEAMGVVVQEASLRASLPQTYALGDCASVGGRAWRFVEPIRRQAQTIAASICGLPEVAYESRPALVQVKTAGYRFTSAG